eukprot:1482592-Rhodomonas_salina.1
MGECTWQTVDDVDDALSLSFRLVVCPEELDMLHGSFRSRPPSCTAQAVLSRPPSCTAQFGAAMGHVPPHVLRNAVLLWDREHSQNATLRDV